jgi:hypothetical protein
MESREWGGLAAKVGFAGRTLLNVVPPRAEIQRFPGHGVPGKFWMRGDETNLV